MKCIENYEGFSKISYNNYSLESKNMKTKKIKRPVCYLVGLLAFGLMLYSCLQDETDLDSQETTGKVIKGKNRELSIDVARSWYEARQTPVVTTRSVVTHFELMTKLHWKKGYENRKGKFEVVEVPLLTRGGAVLMDRETMEKYKEKERGKIRNISRMVIIKNLETGEIINFVMHIVGTYDYLMKAKHFEDNSYLYRAPDLSGSIYFYEPEGALVNGWQYEDGKIVATISQGTEEGSSMQDTIDTRGIVLKPVCHTESVYVEHNECNGFTYQDPEYGLSFGAECRKVGKWETVEVCIEVPTYEEDGNIGGEWNPNENTNGGYIPPKPNEEPPLDDDLKRIIRENKNLNETELNELSDIVNRIPDNCGDYAVYTYLINNNHCFNTVSRNNNVGGEGATAGYQPGSSNLVFYGNDPIQYSSFTHEMFHFFQHKFRGYYKEEEKGFMEFERNLYADIIFFVNNLKGNWHDYDTLAQKQEGWVYSGADCKEEYDTTNEYKEWLKDITNNCTTLPTIIRQEDFLKFAKFYGQVNHAYNVEKKYLYDENIGYTPVAISNALTIAHNNCK